MKSLILFFLFFVQSFAQADCRNELAGVVRLNTSNAGKRREFERLFPKQKIVEFTAKDLEEIDADAVTVVVQKASQFGPTEEVLVEDSSLSIEGEQVGVNVRWMIESLPKMIGKRATWTVLLAQRKGDVVEVYKGEVSGHIAAKRGEGFGFDPVFVPEGENLTFAESKPDRLNARARAVQNFIANKIAFTKPVITTWSGPWQAH